MRAHRRFIALLLAPIALLGVACGSSGSSTSADSPGTSVAAAPSGSILVYSGRNEKLVKPIIDQFTADTGIKVELRAGDSGELAAQIISEGSASPADVFFSQDAGALGALASRNMLDELVVEDIQMVPAGYRATDNTWVGVSGRARVLAYNPALVPNPPTTIDALVDPQWKGKVGYAPTNASWQSFVTALRVLRGEAAAEQWLRAFAANEPKAYQSNGAVRDAVHSGEISLGLVNHYYLWQKVAQEGEANVNVRNQYLAPGDPGGLVNVAGVGVLDTSGNKPAAFAFVDYLLTPKAQEYFAKETFEYPMVPGVPPSVNIPALNTLQPPTLDLSDLESIEQTQELLQKVGLLSK